MDSADQLLERIANPVLTPDERAPLRARLARRLEQSGDYEGAREAMSGLWSRVGERPELNGLSQETAADVLLQVGILTTCIGSVKQIPGAQEIAKDLISESITAFESLNQTRKVVEAQAALALCYWRQGELNEARTVLKDALSRLSDKDSDQKALVLVRSAVVEATAGRLNDSLRILTLAAPLFEKSNHALQGKFHGELGTTLKNLGAAENRQDYIDRALIEYAAASYYFERAGNTRYCAGVENNLGFLFSTVGKFTEAHEHLDRARELFVGLKDSVHTAQVDDTRARVLLGEGQNEEAEKLARAAAQVLEKGDERSLLAEALTTHGVALARTGRYARARLTLQRAALVAAQAGDLEHAGLAALTVIEELGWQSTPTEMSAVYARAAELLAGSKHPGVPARLVACARRVTGMFATESGPVAAEEQSVPPSWEGFSFKKEVRRYERQLIERALKDAGGRITRAAKLLGFTHHYTLVTLINRHHKDLLPARSPVVPRRRSIIRDAGQRQQAEDKGAQTLTILHVEDSKLVADIVKETLEAEGWRVESCPDGRAALSLLVGDSRYDLLLFDYDLPGVSGVELLRLARKLPHRRRTPTIVFSASDCEAEAWRAGADAVLRKPEDVSAVAETVARLLKS